MNKTLIEKSIYNEPFLTIFVIRILIFWPFFDEKGLLSNTISHNMIMKLATYNVYYVSINVWMCIHIWNNYVVVYVCVCMCICVFPDTGKRVQRIRKENFVIWISKRVETGWNGFRPPFARAHRLFINPNISIYRYIYCLWPPAPSMYNIPWPCLSGSLLLSPPFLSHVRNWYWSASERTRRTC